MRRPTVTTTEWVSVFHEVYDAWGEAKAWFSKGDLI